MIESQYLNKGDFLSKFDNFENQPNPLSQPLSWPLDPPRPLPPLHGPQPIDYINVRSALDHVKWQNQMRLLSLVTDYS